MDKFWDLFAQSVITQSFITAVVITTDCVLVIINRPIPQEMWTLTMLVAGFWFGSKIGFSQGLNKTQTTAKPTPCPED